MTQARSHVRPQKAEARPVSRPQDRQEREAHRAADVVAGGGSFAGWSFSTVPASGAVQRQEVVKEKTDDEKKKEALTKAGEAALATPQGQALKEKVLNEPLVKTVKDAVTSPAGIAVTGVAAAGGVAALAATGKELPFQPPAIPLDKITPGLSAQITYNGPVNAPTFVGLTITYTEQGPKGKGKAADDPRAREAAAAAAFQRTIRYAPGSKEAEDQRLTEQAISNLVARSSGLPGLTFPLTPPPKKDEEKAPVQPSPASSTKSPPALVDVDGALSAPGRPLEASARRKMEARFGYDFSGVRIHDDARAAATASAIDAAAFTVGDDIAFAPGRYSPKGPGGKQLLAHELAHVVQQSPRGRAVGAPGTPGRPLDSEVREYFEPRLGLDLGHVRVHHDADAAADARDRRAQAYTVGSHVVFGQGRYSPSTARGRWLLAHELAHVAQGREGRGVDTTPTVERDASAAATKLTQGAQARVSARRDASDVHLFGEPDNVPNLTFISQHGEQGFLNQAVQYHRMWGLAPQRFNSMQQLVAALAQNTGAIARLRIVSHADFDNIFTPLFDGGSAGIAEEDLRAFGESDVAGLRRRLGGHLIQGALADQVLSDAKTNMPAVFVPFGLNVAGSVPAGAVAELISSSTDLLAVRTATGAIPANQRATLDAGLTAELDGLRAQVQQAAPTGAGVTAPQAQDLQNAILGVRAVSFNLPQQGGAFITGVQTATAALAAGFRTNLNAVRARLSSASTIDLRGCRVGQKPTYLAAVAQFFGGAGGQPKVTGPDLFQSYPKLGWRAVEDRNIRRHASDSDVQTALAHWASVTGLRGRLLWWLTFLAGVLRQESERAAAAANASPLLPPSLSGGLVLHVDPFIASLSPDPLLPLPPLQAPTLARPRPPASRFGAGTLTNPLVELARREIPKYTAPDGELRYYLEAGLPLPVQAAANVQNIKLFFRAGHEREAIDAWLNSEWATAAPGLTALQAGQWQRDELRQVEAVSDLDAQRRTLAMFVSPDPRYAEHIKST
jgi:hypothetical protein